MITRYPPKGAAKEQEEQKNGPPHEGHDEHCRCRETSRMSPTQLLKLMMDDLAFWKKKENKG